MTRRLPIFFPLVLCLTLGCGGAPATVGQPAATAADSPTAASKATSAPTPGPSPSPSPSPVPLAVVRLVLPRASLGAWPIDVAERKGFFQQQGVAVDRAEDEGEKATDAVEGRGRDVALVSTATVVGAVKEGHDLVMIAGAVNRAAFSLMAARDVEDIADLRGKPLGIRDPQDVSAGLLRRVLTAGGLEASQRLVPFPDSGVRTAAVANGTVGASLLDAVQAARLQGAGFKTLANAFEAVPDFQAEALVVRRDWARQNDDRLVRFLRAIIAADRWIYAPTNRQEAIEILTATVRLTAADAGRLYEQYVDKQPAIPRDGELQEPGVRTVVDLLDEIEALPPPLPDPATLVDGSYVRRAQ